MISENKPIEVSLAELKNLRRNLKKHRETKGKNKIDSQIYSTRKRNFNADVSKMSSVGLSEDQIWINQHVEHLFKERRNKNWYFI